MHKYRGREKGSSWPSRGGEASRDGAEQENDNESADDLQDLHTLSPEEYDKIKYAKFGQRLVNNTEAIQQRLYEVKQSFYNRLESARLIKKQGRIPFTEHMTVTSEDPLQSADAMLRSDHAGTLGVRSLEINDDIKREIAFYNVTRQNVMQGMKILVQAKVPISRPDDFLAEMVKTDEHMLRVKGRLLKQQNKM